MSVPQAKDNSMRLVITLVVTCLLSGAVLAGVYGWMGPIIDARRAEATISVGLRGIFAEADTFDELELDPLPTGVQAPIYEVRDSAKKVLGIWFTGEAKGFGGPVRMAIGIDPVDSTIVGVRVLEHSETPGLGSPIEELSFLAQLENKDLGDAFKIGGDVSGLTGATVSSRAVFDGVSQMGRAVLANLGYEVEVDETAITADAGALDDAALAAQLFGVSGPVTLAEVRGTWPAGVSAPVYEVTDSAGNALGVFFHGEAKGYGGPVHMAIALDAAASKIARVKVTEQQETPGLGSLIEGDDFLKQLKGKSLADPFTIGDDVDGLTMATISSNAVFDGVSAMGRNVLTELGYEIKAGVAADALTVDSKQVALAEDLFQATGLVLTELADVALPEGVEGPVYDVRRADGQGVGVLFTGEAKGYGGPVRMAVALDVAGEKIAGVRVLAQNETPGLGSLIEGNDFLKQLVGKPLSDPFTIGDDVDGLTMATISANAVFGGVSQMGRDMVQALPAVGYSAGAPQAAASVAPAADPEPVYADALRRLIGNDIAFAPANVWEVKQDKTLVGMATVVTMKGYGGPIEVLVVVDPAQAKVVAVDVLHETETPGLGSEIRRPAWLGQFAGKPINDAFVVGQDVDGITLATFSAQKVADAVKQAIERVLTLYPQG